MSNKFLTVQEIARAALPILHDNLVFPALTYRNSTSEYNKKGDVVQVRKPPMYTADEFDGEINLQDVNEENVLVTLDKWVYFKISARSVRSVSVISSISSKIRKSESISPLSKIRSKSLTKVFFCSLFIEPENNLGSAM